MNKKIFHKKGIKFIFVSGCLIFCVFIFFYICNSYYREYKTRRLGAIPIAEEMLFPEKYKEGVNAVTRELIKDKETPEEFFAQIELGNGSIIFHLWHKDALSITQIGVDGNPGGKCRDYHYDISQDKITKKIIWQ